MTLVGFVSALLVGQLAEARTKILEFPREYPVGFICVVPTDPGVECTIRGTRVARAQGRVVVPTDKLLKFEPDHHFFEHPECLLKLPPDAFDYIELRFCSMADGEEKMSDTAAGYVVNITGIRAISFDKSDTTDSGAAKVAVMPHLEGVSFSGSMVNGSCLSALRHCRSLRFVRFGDNAVDNNYLRYLSELPNLQRLTLHRVGLSKAGLTQVCKCASLTNLDLGLNVDIDDTCIPVICRLKKLREINLVDTKVSVKGLLALTALQCRRIELPHPLASYSLADQELLRKTFPGEILGAPVKKQIQAILDMMPPDPSKNH